MMKDGNLLGVKELLQYHEKYHLTLIENVVIRSKEWIKTMDTGRKM